MIRCPKAPACSGQMVERQNKATGSTFLGCWNYPDCAETMPIPESVKMRRAGALELPGLDDAAAPPRPGRQGEDS